MSWREPTLGPLPSTPELSWTPECGILAALDASLVLTVRTLKAEHPTLDEPDERTGEPLLLLAESILASAACLHELIAGYVSIAGCSARFDCRQPRASRMPLSPAYAPAEDDDDDDDIPF